MSQLSPSTFKSIIPSRYITFSLSPTPNFHLRLAVLDSPVASGDAAAAMSVPPGRESDWIFSTFSGHLQLLLSSPTPLSRLFLIGNSPSHSTPTSYVSSLHDPDHHDVIHDLIYPLLLNLTPKPASDIPFLVYEDDVVKLSVIEVLTGPRVGEMLVENVEMEIEGAFEFRRRLRFKRIPNFVQTQVKIRIKVETGSKVESLGMDEDLGNVEFELEKGVLVHPYLSPMVAGVSVMSRVLERRFKDGVRVRALCLGVGGGALLGFLSDRLGFEVVGVEVDEVVLDVARRYFGLGSEGGVSLVVGDGIEYVERIGKSGVSEEFRFDVVMVDLDSSDAVLGVCAPPVEFVEKSVVVAVREVVKDGGVLVINVIPSDEPFYEGLVRLFEEVFEEVYEIDVGNGDNFVLIATKSKVGIGLDDASEEEEGVFLKMLKGVVSSTYIDSIRRISKSGGTAVCK